MQERITAAVFDRFAPFDNQPLQFECIIVVQCFGSNVPVSGVTLYLYANLDPGRLSATVSAIAKSGWPHDV